MSNIQGYRRKDRYNLKYYSGHYMIHRLVQFVLQFSALLNSNAGMQSSFIIQSDYAYRKIEEECSLLSCITWKVKIKIAAKGSKSPAIFLAFYNI